MKRSTVMVFMAWDSYGRFRPATPGRSRQLKWSGKLEKVSNSPD